VVILNKIPLYNFKVEVGKFFLSLKRFPNLLSQKISQTLNTRSTPSLLALYEKFSQKKNTNPLSRSKHPLKNPLLF